jgi:hypothetical protein
MDGLLDTKTSSATLRKGDEVLVEIFSAGLGFDPPLRTEHVRVWEDIGVAVEQIRRRADDSLE